MFEMSRDPGPVEIPKTLLGTPGIFRQSKYTTKSILLHLFSQKQNFKTPFKFYAIITAQKMNFSIKDFFSKCDQIRRKLRIWSHLLKKSLMENFIFRAVHNLSYYC